MPDPSSTVYPVDVCTSDAGVSPAPIPVPAAISIPDVGSPAPPLHSPYHAAYMHQSSIRHEFGKHAHIYDRSEMRRVAKHESLDYHITHNHM